jgi:hypothetical protein
MRLAAPAAATAGCPAAPAPATPPPGGLWTKSVDPGPHLTQVRAAVAALNAAGSALKITIVEPGDAKADVRVLPDEDLEKNVIARTSGCLKPGFVSARATVVLDPDVPRGTNVDLSMTRQLAVAFGLQRNEEDTCSTLAFNQRKTIRGCDSSLGLLQPVDKENLVRTWGRRPEPSRSATGRAT